MTDAELKAMTPEFKERLKNGQTLDDILVDAFAVVREASTRILGMRHFKVQLIRWYGFTPGTYSRDEDR